MKDQGFSTVVGVENSEHRASVVGKTLGVPVAVGNFEGSSVQESLKTYGMFDLVLSHHVFEHVSHPEAFISALSKLQPEGGVFVLSVPDVAGEHAGYVALYPPHLHSYSKYGMEVLLNRYGYEVIEDHSPGLDNMLIAARKVAHPVARIQKPHDAFTGSLNKLHRGLGLKDMPTQGLAQLWWLEPGRGYDDARVSQKMRGVPSLESVWWRATKALLWLKARIGRMIASHGMLVGPLESRYTDTPIELQWKGPIRFLFK
jgi:SAM-dependent methyltransferase